MVNLFLLIICICIFLAIVVFFSFLVSGVLISTFQNSAKKWIEKKNDEIYNEFRKFDLNFYHEGEYKVLKVFSGTGYYIGSRSCSDRTKTLSPREFMKVIFKLHDTPVNDVIIPLFEEYKKEQNLKEQQILQKIYSKNKKERKVQFMPNKKEESK